MKQSTIAVIATLMTAALVAQADVVVDYSGGTTNTPAGGSFTYTFSDLGLDPVTMTPGTSGSGALSDANRDTLTYGGGSGSFTLSVAGYLSLDSAGWTSGTVDALEFNMNGLSVEASNGAMRKGEALIYTVSIDSTLQSYLNSNSYSLRLTEFAAGIMDTGASLEFYTEASGSGTLVATAADLTPVSVSAILTDGMQFAFKNPATGTQDTSLKSIAVDIIPVPEPATPGLIVASGAGILLIRRRLMM